MFPWSVVATGQAALALGYQKLRSLGGSVTMASCSGADDALWEQRMIAAL